MVSQSRSYKTGLRAFNISASGIPNNILDNSQVVFHHPLTKGLSATSSLFYDDDTNQLQFVGGTFSGSFTGDGSGLTGVIGTLPHPLISGDGIASGSGVPFSYDGTEQVQVKVDLATNSGLEFASGLRLASSLAGDGLYYPHASSLNHSTMSIALSPGGTSGLTTASGQLAITSYLSGS